MGVKAAVVATAVAVVAAAGTVYAVTSPPTYTTVSVPASYGGNTIAADCSSDATAGLDAFFASLTSPTIVNMATNGCYSVSPNAADLLTVDGLTNIVVNGHGSTLYQPSYLESDGTTNACGHNIYAPVLGMWSDTGITFNDLTIKGPVGNGLGYDCQENQSEGDNGIYIGNHATNDGSTGLTFNGVTVENLNGDALDLYPHLSDNTGVNSTVVFENGAMSNWGWYGIVPEGIDGLNFTGNTVSAANGRFLDAEVDGTCGMAIGYIPSHTYTAGEYVSANVGSTPTGLAQANVTFTTSSATGGWQAADLANLTNITAANTAYSDGSYYNSNCLNGSGALTGDGIWNLAIVNNTFTEYAQVDAEGPPGCIPEKNWTFAGNTGSLGIQLDGANQFIQCDGGQIAAGNVPSQALTISNNSGGGAGSVCGGSPGSPPEGCAGFGINNWANVTVSNNDTPYSTGTPGSLRTVTDGTSTLNSTTFTAPDANFTSADACNICYLTGPGIPSQDYIASVTNSTTAVLSQAAKTGAGTGTFDIGQAAAYPNTPRTVSVGLCYVTGATIKNNNFDGGYSLWDNTHCFAQTPTPPNQTTNVATCGNNWQLGNPYAYYFYNSTGGGSPNGYYQGSYTLDAAPPAAPVTDTAC